MSKKLTTEQKDELLNLLKIRFEKNMHRHQSIIWKDVEEKIIDQSEILWTINEMEISGGEPDVISFRNDEISFTDFSKESPIGRRSLAYDYEGQTSRKEHQPQNNAIDVAKKMRLELLDEEEYRFLQSIETIDHKTSSWLKTPESIRKLGGAIFGDYRYETVFIYHNGAQSYYAARGFRGKIKI